MVRALLLLGLVAACGGAADTPGTPESAGAGTSEARAERVAASRAVLEAQVERIAAAGMHAEVMRAIARLMDEHPELPAERELAIPGGSVTWQDLSHYRSWNSPAAEGRPIAALDFERADHPFGIIAEYARALAAHDVDLLVVPVPTRIQVHPERLPGVEPRATFAGGSPGTARLLLALAEEGVEVVDLLSVFGAARDAEAEPLYHALDSHWTPRAVALAADVIAERLERMPWFERGPAREGADFEVRRERGPFELYAKLADGPVEVRFDRVVDAAGRPAHERDRSSPILLIGDSFTAQYQDDAADLASQLYARTGWRIDAITLSAGGANKVWDAIRRRGDGLAGKRVVIWVFTARALGNPEFEAVPIFGD